MTVLALRLSPRGRRAGIALAGDGRHQAAVAVLPKVWASRPAESTCRWDGPSLLIVGHELDTVRVDGPAAKLAVLEGLVRHSAEGAERNDRSPLVEQVVARPPTESPPGERGGTVVDLLHLKARLGLGTAGAAPDRRLLGRASSAWLLRPLVHLDFTAEVEGLIGTLRRGYRPVREELTTIRGRVDSRSLVRFRRTGVPRLWCSFDEFSRETPLARALATALDLVAAGNVRGGLADDGLLRRVPGRALALRRALADVRSFGRREALQVLDALRLDRLSRPWERARDLARLVLRGHGYDPSASASTFPAFEVDVPTADVWEGIVERAAKRGLGPRRVGAQRSCPPPWAGGTSVGMRPDLLLDVDGTTWCVDAKYKTPPGRRGPAGADLHQIFAYSHLASFRGRPIERCALVYPTASPTLRRVDGYDRNPPTDGVRPTLDTLALPFPRPDDVATAGGWRRYLRSTSDQLLAALRVRDEAGEDVDVA